MRKLFFILIVVFIFINEDSISGDGFRRPFKQGDYYEFIFTHYESFPPDTFRYTAKVMLDTLINGLYTSTVQIYNEPGMGNHTVIYKFDTTSLTLYGGTNGCLDSNGNHLSIGFNMPIGFVWNTCSDTLGGIFFRSSTIDTATQSQLFFSGIPLKTVTRQDTVGGTIEGTTDYKFSEMFGLIYFYRGYGSPLGPAPYDKILVGAIIDSITYGSVVLSIKQISNEIPNQFRLYQNFPNPFNPSTTIRFDVAQRSDVKLSIFNLLGKEIKVLVNEHLNAGSYEYAFNSEGLPSGVYYYQLHYGNALETKKMVVVK